MGARRTTAAKKETAEAVNQRLRRLSRAVARLTFSPPVTHTYNPLDYAWAPHHQYVARYARHGVPALLVGMNPGPWGMVQSGIPFGDIESVRDWLGIDEHPKAPTRQHPKRPILGFDCTRSEVSGRRLWGWAQDRFGAPEKFFERFFVLNYCPLAFLGETGKNLTPDHLPKDEREPLIELCNRSLRDVVDVLAPKAVVGVGKFARTQVENALQDYSGTIGEVLHPSPASPAANRGWAKQAEAQLRALGVL